MHLLLILFYFLRVLDSVLCTDDIYEQHSLYIQNSDYVDPNSLYFNRHTQKVQDTSVISYGIVSTDNDRSHCKDRTYEVFAKRLINILLSNANFKTSEGKEIGDLQLEATAEELGILKDFGNGKISIREIDSIISNIIRPIKTDLFDDTLSYADKLLIHIYQHRIIFGAMLLISFVIIITLKVKWTRARIILLIIEIMFTISFILTWWELLQEAQVKLMAQQTIYSKVPDECRKSELSFFSSMTLYFGYGKGECFKYYESVMMDPALKVTPVHAFSHMVTKFFLDPLLLAGKYFSIFVDNLTSEIHFPFNHIVKVIIILLMPFFFGLLLFVWLGGSLGFRLGPLLHVYLHGRQSIEPPNSLTRSDRQAIEVIQQEVHEAHTLLTETKQIKPAKKSSPKMVKAATQTEELMHETTNKQKESASENSDKFSEEEEEYEKISKKKVENEINQFNNIEILKNENIENKEEKNTNKSEIKNKTFLEVGSGDN